MPVIETMTGQTTGNSFYLATVRANSDGVTVTPMNSDKPAFMANAAPDIAVNPQLLKLLDKAGLSPPPPGQTLTISYVNDKLLEAGLGTDDRISVKRELVKLGMLHQGRPVNVFGGG